MTKFKNNKKNQFSISFYLIISVIFIFVVMTFTSNFIIGIFQENMTEKMINNIQFEMDKNSENHSVVLMDTLQVKNTIEFKLMSFLVSLINILIGSILIYVVILQLIKPMKQLSQSVSEIDINNVNYIKDKIRFTNGPIELIELSKSFNDAIEKIYSSYQKQKNFSANVAHELRTPIAIVQSKIDLFKMENKVNLDNAEFIIGLEDGIQKLVQLVDNILILSDSKEIKIKEFSLKNMIEEIFLDLEDKAYEKNLELRFSNLIDENIIIKSDEILFQIALFNLIENAIKYNKVNGYIEINFKDDMDYIIIDIIDSGIGISDAEKKSIFDIFYRSENSRNKKTGGYGIGLSICLNIMNKLSYKLQIKDNEVGGEKLGTIFSIIIDKNISR